MAHVIVIGAGLGGIPAAFTRTGSLTPVYETYVLKAIGIVSLKKRA